MRITAALVITVVTALGCGCAVNRNAPTPEELQHRRITHTADVVRYQRVVNERTVRRMKLEADEQLATGKPAVYDILILSGGGDYGAFGAGFLEGWGAVREEGYQRPEFDLVTGVSTGALIAPFAFVGDQTSYERVLVMYSEPKADWFEKSGLLFFLPGRQSFMRADGMRRDLEREVNAEVIKRIASGEGAHRTLWVGTTDLDLGLLHPWDLTVEARKIVDENRDSTRFYDVLMASAAIPAVFPPVIIDGWLYVDGGTTTNILYDADLRSDSAPVAMYRRQFPDSPMPKFRFWVIINNQLGGEPQIVQPNWMSITKASVATAIRSSTIGALRQLSLQAELQRRDGLDVEFRFIAIPDEWRSPNTEAFNKETMGSLAKLGMEMGADPRSWKTDLVSEPKSEDIVPGAAGGRPVDSTGVRGAN